MRELGGEGAVLDRRRKKQKGEPAMGRATRNFERFLLNCF
jgi:hypothetical protein